MATMYLALALGAGIGLSYLANKPFMEMTSPSLIPTTWISTENNQFKHNVYSPVSDYLSHPDFKHHMDNVTYKKDLGVFGQSRFNAKIHPGANITPMYRTANLIQ